MREGEGDFLSFQLLTKVMEYYKVLLPWLHTMTQRRHECLCQCQTEEQDRKDHTIQHEVTYEVRYAVHHVVWLDRTLLSHCRPMF